MKKNELMLSYKNSTKVIKDSQTVTAILSVGATEQFGPYLPMHLDTLIAEHQATVFGERLNAYVLPTLPFNTSEEHANQIGTVTVSPTVLSMMLEEIIVNLHRQGFTQFILCNGHGGAYWESAFVKQVNFKYPEIVIITTDGCWGSFEPGVYSPDELATIGETFWTTFTEKRAEHLKETLTTAVRLRNLPGRNED